MGAARYRRGADASSACRSRSIPSWRRSWSSRWCFLFPAQDGMLGEAAVPGDPGASCRLRRLPDRLRPWAEATGRLPVVAARCWPMRNCPVVVDADGINVLARAYRCTARRGLSRGAHAPRRRVSPPAGQAAGGRKPYAARLRQLAAEDRRDGAAARDTGLLICGADGVLCQPMRQSRHGYRRERRRAGGHSRVTAGAGADARACSGCGGVAARNGGRPLRRPDGGVRPAALGRCGGAAATYCHRRGCACGEAAPY